MLGGGYFVFSTQKIGEKNGQPVTNLENYLGALGHSVILVDQILNFRLPFHKLECIEFLPNFSTRRKYIQSTTSLK